MSKSFVLDYWQVHLNFGPFFGQRPLFEIFGTAPSIYYDTEYFKSIDISFHNICARFKLTTHIDIYEQGDWN